jgi:hypothetical protein
LAAFVFTAAFVLAGLLPYSLPFMAPSDQGDQAQTSGSIATKG